jgi:phytoene desaturase
MVKKAAVIGAGISGLYTCLLLEKHGYTVDLFEKSSTIGGRMASENK